jgi:hypothetical protein
MSLVPGSDPETVIMSLVPGSDPETVISNRNYSAILATLQITLYVHSRNSS